jgi:hypothetical protein
MVDWGASLMALTPLLLIGGGAIYLGLRFVRGSERRGPSGKELADLTDRVGRLEESLSSMSSEMQRIAEAEQFTTRLLQERKSPANPPSP